MHQLLVSARKFRCFLASVLILTVAAANSLWAGTGSVYDLPVNVADARNGLQIRFDTRWINGNGYRPVRVRVVTVPPLPSASDRTLQVTLETSAYTAARPEMRVTDEIVLPAGQVVAEKVLAVPQNASWRSGVVTVTEGGVRLRDLSGELTGFSTLTTGYEWTEVWPAVLLIHPQAPVWTQRAPYGWESAEAAIPDLVALDGLMPASGQVSPFLVPNAGMVGSVPVPVPDATAIAAGSPGLSTPQGEQDSQGSRSPLAPLSSLSTRLTQQARYEVLAPADVPADWTQLTCADLIFLSLESALELSHSAPAKWRALRDWVEAGHTLCIYGLEDGFARREELDALLAPASQRPGDSANAGWLLPAASDWGKGFQDAYTVLRNMSRSANTFPTPEPASATFRLRKLGTGQVVASAAADPFADSTQLAWLLCSLDPHDWAWFQRYGFSQRRANQSFWEFMIPGVGVPPVKTFMALITLFVVVIGPVNYFLLKRQKRLHLLLVTVPLGAMLVATLLIVYALLADGLGVRARTRSFTLLDQRQARAATWSRQAYYAGLVPSRGLQFANTSAVFPIEQQPRAGFRGGRLRELTWTNGQSLRGAYLRAREFAQFMVVDVAASTAKLELDLAGNRVTNELGAQVLGVAVRDDDGNWHVGRDIAAGAQGPLRKGTLDDVTRMLRELMKLPPAGVAPPPVWNRWYGAEIDSDVQSPNMSTSVLERGLSAAQAASGLGPRSYIAVISQTTWLPLGVNNARLESPLHVVQGQW